MTFGSRVVKSLAYVYGQVPYVTAELLRECLNQWRRNKYYPSVRVYSKLPPSD